MLHEGLLGLCDICLRSREVESSPFYMLPVNGSHLWPSNLLQPLIVCPLSQPNVVIVYVHQCTV